VARSIDDGVCQLLVDVGRAFGRPVLRLSGELDLYGAPKLLDVGTRLLESNELDALVVDVSDLTFCDSSGLKVLAELRDEANAAGCTLVLRSPQPIVRRVIELTGFHHVVPIEPGERGACRPERLGPAGQPR
jgi:anti-anti-sigma factor